jgi:nicotinamide riboside transporter PnuC
LRSFNAVFRVAGTMAGALVAIAIYHASHENPYALVLAGFLFSIPNFWLIVTRPKFATTGRFILLAYNLTALYAFNKRELDIHVSYIALKRVIAVVIGTL